MQDRKYAYDLVGAGEASVSQQHYRMVATEEGQVWRQYGLAAIVSFGIACTGYCMGWSSPVHSILVNVTTSPLDHVVTTEEEAWMGSLLSVGTIFGPVIAGFIVSKIGQKWSLISCSIPLLVGWILIIISSNIEIIYAGRFFGGVATGMVYTISPMYCGEIATDASRGALGSYLQLFVSIGFLIVYIVGPFVSYDVISYVGFATVILYTVGVFFIPESPIYHLTKNNREAATKCLAVIRGRSEKAVENEIDKMTADVIASQNRTAKITDIFKGNNYKALYIACGLMFFQQFSGIDAVLFYSSIIFEASGASLDPSYATIIIGIVLVAASLIAPFVVDKLGRRFLLLISACGSAIAQGLLGMYFILADNQSPLVASLGFLPVLSLVLFILFYSVGLGAIPWAIMGELLPIEVKNVVSPIATTLCWIMMFLITRFFSSVAEAIGMGPTFCIFGVFCVIAFFFTLIFVPETKGKGFQEIQDMLAGKSRSSNKS